MISDKSDMFEYYIYIYLYDKLWGGFIGIVILLVVIVIKLLLIDSD